MTLPSWWMSVRELSRELGVSRATVRELIALAPIPSIQDGRTIRYDAIAARAVLARLR